MTVLCFAKISSLFEKNLLVNLYLSPSEIRALNLAANICFKKILIVLKRSKFVSLRI